MLVEFFFKSQSAFAPIRNFYKSIVTKCPPDFCHSLRSFLFGDTKSSCHFTLFRCRRDSASQLANTPAQNTTGSMLGKTTANVSKPWKLFFMARGCGRGYRSGWWRRIRFFIIFFGNFLVPLEVREDGRVIYL